MLTLFYNKLIYKHWLVNQFTLIKDVINVLQFITYKIGKIRICQQPLFDDIKNQLNQTYIVYDDIVFRRWYKTPYKQRDFNYCKINNSIIYCYENYINYHDCQLYLDLEVDLPLSNIDFYNQIPNKDAIFICH